MTLELVTSQGQAHGGHAGNGHHDHPASSSELRRQRDELDRQLEERDGEDLLR